MFLSSGGFGYSEDIEAYCFAEWPAFADGNNVSDGDIPVVIEMSEYVRLRITSGKLRHKSIWIWHQTGITELIVSSRKFLQ